VERDFLAHALGRFHGPSGRKWRLWRSVKYEDVYLHAYRDGREARQRLADYFTFYNGRRGHQSLDYRTPDEVYFGACAGELSTAA